MTQDSDTAFHQIFNSAGGGTVGNSSSSRTEFSSNPNGAALRVYVGDTGSGSPANFFRVNDANVPAVTLFDGTNNVGWTTAVQRNEWHTRVRVAQLLRHAVLVRHAGLFSTGRPGYRLYRWRDAVR